MLKENAKKEIGIAIERYPQLGVLEHNLESAVEMLVCAAKKGNKVLVCGNGGSAADSLHIVGELMKGFVLERKIPMDIQQKLKDIYPDDAAYYINNLQGTIPTISLVDEVSLMTAYSNDKCADLVFAQQVLGYGKNGDVLIALSTSGNSANVLHAVRVARACGLRVISMTGASGGKLKELSDVLLNVPSTVTYQIQELHLPVYHALCLAVEEELFGK